MQKWNLAGNVWSFAFSEVECHPFFEEDKDKEGKYNLSTVLTFGFGKYKNTWAAHTININNIKKMLS